MLVFLGVCYVFGLLGFAIKHYSHDEFDSCLIDESADVLWDFVEYDFGSLTAPDLLKLAVLVFYPLIFIAIFGLFVWEFLANWREAHRGN